MTTYRLLRDNKESGPYSEEEMIAKGFKPYDLLWAEGKTAGWQYPSEIAAFKNYAPIVEEQPYDRFYKKQPAQKLVTEEKSNYTAYQLRSTKEPKENNQPKEKDKELAPPVPPAAVRPSYNYNLQNLPARHIHVTLPSGNTVNLTTLVTKKENQEPGSGTSYSNTRKEIVVVPNEQKPGNSLCQPDALANASGTEKKFLAASGSADKSFAAEAFQQAPVYTPAQSGLSWTLVAGAVVGIATMVGLGIMIGLAMNREKNEIAFNQAISHRSKQVSQPVQTQSLPNNLPAVPTTAVAEPSATSDQQLPKKSIVQPAVDLKNGSSPEKAISKEIKKSTPEEKLVAEKNSNKPGEDVAAAKHTIEPAASNMAAVAKKLSVQENDFSSGAFGGIANLKLTLVNGSTLGLASVQVEIDYILANKKIYKTETLLFKDIQAGTQVTVDAPASSRGVKINTRIVKINAKETGISGNAATVKS